MHFTLVSKSFLTVVLIAVTTAPCMAQGWSWFGRSKQNQVQAQQAQPVQTQPQTQYQGGQNNSTPSYNYNYGTYSPQQQTTAAYAPQPYFQQSQPSSRNNKKQKSSSTTKQSSDNGRWYTSWDAAWKEARSQGRPLVVVVVHHGCPVCDQLDATLSNPSAMATLDSAIKVRLEFSENAEFLYRTGVKLTPTFLVFSPTSNGEVYREVGALSLQRLQSLKPSIDSLVSEPAPEKITKSQTSASNDAVSSLDDETPNASI